jgi:HEAT repeat protein
VVAAGIYRRLDAAGQSEAVRAAALKGLVRVDPNGATSLLHAALKSDSTRLAGIAIRELARREGVALAKELPNVGERERVRILWALTDSGRPDVRPVLVEAAASGAEAIRVAALCGLATLGSAADIPMLAGRAANAAGDEQTAARTALGAIRGDAADAAILQAIPGAEPKVKVELIRAVGERAIAPAPEILLTVAADSDRPVRIESVRALRETAGPRQVPALLALLVKTSNANDRREFERAIASAIRRSKEAAVGGVLAAYRSAPDPGVRTSLLNILSAVGNSEALSVIRQALQDPAADIQRSALNALAAWPTPEPMDDLLVLARSTDNPSRQILALRGYIKLIQILRVCCRRPWLPPHVLRKNRRCCPWRSAWYVPNRWNWRRRRSAIRRYPPKHNSRPLRSRAG